MHWSEVLDLVSKGLAPQMPLDVQVKNYWNYQQDWLILEIRYKKWYVTSAFPRSFLLSASANVLGHAIKDRMEEMIDALADKLKGTIHHIDFDGKSPPSDDVAIVQGAFSKMLSPGLYGQLKQLLEDDALAMPHFLKDYIKAADLAKAYGMSPQQHNMWVEYQRRNKPKVLSFIERNGAWYPHGSPELDLVS